MKSLSVKGFIGFDLNQVRELPRLRNLRTMQWRAFKYLLPFGVYLATWRSFHNTGWVVFAPIVNSFGIIPLVEMFLPPNPRNLDKAEEQLAASSRVYDWFLYAILPLQYLALWWYLNGITNPDLLWWERLGRTAAMGLACGVFGINVGHELGHRVKPYEQWLAKALLLTSLYTHFFIEHNRGHHKHVSTPQDPSSAPYRMSLYAFWWRSVSGVYRDAWAIANRDMRKRGLPAFHWRNEMLQLQVLQLAWVAGIAAMFGFKALGWYLIAAVMGFLLLESVNYIEHYGLRRRELQPGKFERALPCHSWNSNHVLGRLMLFELSRHSDHHYLASRKYQVLRHHDDAPQLPTGYPGSILLAMVPPLWFRVMDKQMRRYGIEPGA